YKRCMPKIVDPEQRRRHIVAAVFRVIARDGAGRASLRSIAAEADLAIGSVRHYCGSQQEIREMAIEELTRGFEARFRAHLEDLDNVRTGALSRRVLLTRVLEEFLPLDATRRDEAAVWLEFWTAARTNEEFAPYVAGLRRGMRTIIERMLTGAARAGVLRDGIDEAIETDRLAALLDSLTLRSLETDGLPTAGPARCWVGISTSCWPPKQTDRPHSSTRSSLSAPVSSSSAAGPDPQRRRSGSERSVISSSIASVVAGGSIARISRVMGRGPIASSSAAITREGRNCFASAEVRPVACSRSMASDRSCTTRVTPSKC